jgi:hypothetical protein
MRKLFIIKQAIFNVYTVDIHLFIRTNNERICTCRTEEIWTVERQLEQAARAGLSITLLNVNLTTCPCHVAKTEAGSLTHVVKAEVGALAHAVKTEARSLVKADMGVHVIKPEVDLDHVVNPEMVTFDLAPGWNLVDNLEVEAVNES